MFTLDHLSPKYKRLIFGMLVPSPGGTILAKYLLLSKGHQDEAVTAADEQRCILLRFPTWVREVSRPPMLIWWDNGLMRML